MTHWLSRIIKDLVARVSDRTLAQWRVLPGSSPVPVFGAPEGSWIATIGLNPSGREFVDAEGRELTGNHRRLHTLASLGLRAWEDAEEPHIELLRQYCTAYFRGNPYRAWFDRLDAVLARAGATYYGLGASACHFDLVPYATAVSWAHLGVGTRADLLQASRLAFGMLLQASSVEVVVLNGRSVVTEFERMAGVTLKRERRPGWTLPRRSSPVIGWAGRESVRTFGALALGRAVTVLGFNHNIQSSYGVSNRVLASIGDWVGDQCGSRN